jgi:hypothetical protein
MTLMDFGFAEPSKQNYLALLAHLLIEFYESRAEILELVSPVPEFNLVSRQCGLLPVGKGMSFAFSLPPGWNLDQSSFSDISRWPISHLSGDGPGQ